jgi:tRNA-guanine family transglycosylase
MSQLIYFCAGLDSNICPAANIEAVLINTPDFGDGSKGIEEARKLRSISNAKKMMLDSGGFQLLKAEENGLEISCEENEPIKRNNKINLSPMHVIRAAQDIKPDIFVALDFPIKKIFDPSLQKIEFMRKLGFNITWAIQTSALRKKYCPEIELFIPVQCYNLQQFNLFWERIKGIEFDGFSMPVRNLKVPEIALFLVKFYQLGIKKVHLLGTSSFFNIALAAYSANHLFERISFDATTWRLIAEKECYFNPHNLSLVNLRENVRIDGEIMADCQCVWCHGKSFAYIKNLPYAEKFLFLMCHNHLAIEKITKEMYKNSCELEELRHYLLTNSPNQERIKELHQTLAVIEGFKDEPLDEWKNLLTIKP